ncbi:ketoacyl reductase [Luteitalea sp. TBR-22]|uniref:SDR family NAD(P)-dependent oxidoreductase n=1 Tax=Luteitalea sp. TBR-22 TaxID=2802971 RepID=UPI001AF9ED7E|nr:SDR family NAD(P)-dependent oxidoreductase [Luteitalea sp. TBR-22]BCS34251.1 ketoacyl reductase [Luteitalea sp. TBR-22]
MISGIAHDMAADAPRSTGSGSRPHGSDHAALVALGGLAAAVAATAWWRAAHAYQLRGRTVLITGGVRGLGLLLAREFGRRGARLAIVSRTPSEIGRAEDQLRASGLDVIAECCDVRDPRAVADLVRLVVGRTGRLDVVVNNAGVIQAAPFEHAQLEDFQESLDTHFWGPLYLTREALPFLRRAPGGARLLNISSFGGRVGVPHLAAYSAGKFALVGLSETLRAELHKDGVLVTTATPGLMRTGSHGKILVRGQHEKEALWFGAGVATPLTSMSGTRAARELVDACVAGRAHATPGLQFRLAEIAETLVPQLAAGVKAIIAGRLLPGPSDRATGEVRRATSEVGFGWLTPLLPNAAARANNEIR